MVIEHCWIRSRSSVVLCNMGEPIIHVVGKRRLYFHHIDSVDFDSISVRTVFLLFIVNSVVQGIRCVPNIDLVLPLFLNNVDVRLMAYNEE